MFSQYLSHMPLVFDNLVSVVPSSVTMLSAELLSVKQPEASDVDKIVGQNKNGPN